MTGKTD